MKKEDGFYFNPKKWLGDASIIAMDWDCKGMHLHLMAIAWQQNMKGHLLDDENLIRKLLGNPEQSDWENRIKPQIFSSWKKKVVKEGNIERQYWYQPGIIKTVKETSGNDSEPAPVKRTRKKKTELIEVENPEFEGFNLESLLKTKPTATILHEPSNADERSTIWSIGVQLVKKQGESDAKARGFLARLIKEYGDKAVAAAVAQLSLKQVSPAEVHSYLVGILKKQQEGVKKAAGRGSVSL
jgi:hypothetical protein